MVRIIEKSEWVRVRIIQLRGGAWSFHIRQMKLINGLNHWNKAFRQHLFKLPLLLSWSFEVVRLALISLTVIRSFTLIVNEIKPISYFYFSVEGAGGGDILRFFGLSILTHSVRFWPSYENIRRQLHNTIELLWFLFLTYSIYYGRLRLFANVFYELILNKKI